MACGEELADDVEVSIEASDPPHAARKRRAPDVMNATRLNFMATYLSLVQRSDIFDTNEQIIRSEVRSPARAPIGVFVTVIEERQEEDWRGMHLIP